MSLPGLELDGPARLRNRRIGTTGCLEKDGVPEMRCGTLGLELKRALELRFGAGPVPVAVQPDEAQDSVSVGQTLVECQRAERRLPGSGVVIEQGTRFGQTREGRRERGIGGGCLLEIPERRAQVVECPAGQVRLALRTGLRRPGLRLGSGTCRGRRRDLDPASSSTHLA